jgi:hypothetical protein
VGAVALIQRDEVVMTEREQLEAKELELRVEKLSVEIRLLRQDVGPRGRFARLMWPVLASAATVTISLGALIISLWTAVDQRERERTQAVAQFVATNLGNATDSDARESRRVSAIWALSSMWPNQEHRPALANALATLSADGDAMVRAAAADVIGLAIVEKQSQPERAELARVLYGSTRDWAVGAVVRQNRLLANMGPSSERDQKLASTREAIRKNWEYLEDVDLGKTDLRRIQLYEARLARSSFAGSNLDEANLRGADLTGAWMEGVSLDGAILEFANVRAANGSLKSHEAFHDWALTHGRAVDMDSDSFDRWKGNGFRTPGRAAWEKWRKQRFPVDKKGVPVLP